MADTDKAEILGNAIMAAMQTAIVEHGMSPQEAFDTGLAAIGSISIQAAGEYQTGAKLIIVVEAPTSRAFPPARRSRC